VNTFARAVVQVLGVMVFAIVSIAGRCLAEEQVPAPAAPPDQTATPQPERRPVIEQNGLKFVLLGSTRHDNVDTEEYLLEGETRESWSQMLTYQRVSLPEPVTADQYASVLKRHLEKFTPQPKFRVAQQGKAASIFAVHYGASSKDPEQVGLALIMLPDALRPSVLHVVHYTARLDRISAEDLDVQVKRWHARFQSQAASIKHSATP
jgi:hypothetical protein